MKADDVFEFIPSHLVMGNFLESCTLKFKSPNVNISEYTINFFKSQNMEISEIRNDHEFIYVTFIKNDND